MAKFSLWSRIDGDVEEMSFVEGEAVSERDWSFGSERLKVVEAVSWCDAMHQFYDWLGWKPYKPAEGCTCEFCSSSSV